MRRKPAGRSHGRVRILGTATAGRGSDLRSLTSGRHGRPRPQRPCRSCSPPRAPAPGRAPAGPAASRHPPAPRPLWPSNRRRQPASRPVNARPSREAVFRTAAPPRSQRVPGVLRADRAAAVRPAGAGGPPAGGAVLLRPSRRPGWRVRTAPADLSGAGRCTACVSGVFGECRLVSGSGMIGPGPAEPPRTATADRSAHRPLSRCHDRLPPLRDCHGRPAGEPLGRPGRLAAPGDRTRAEAPGRLQDDRGRLRAHPAQPAPGPAPSGLPGVEPRAVDRRDRPRLLRGRLGRPGPRRRRGPAAAVRPAGAHLRHPERTVAPGVHRPGRDPLPRPRGERARRAVRDR
ncbi:hypothetical protein SUDANB106_05680 [Streptomyces sp. enrichment culture]